MVTSDKNCEIPVLIHNVIFEKNAKATPTSSYKILHTHTKVLEIDVSPLYAREYQVWSLDPPKSRSQKSTLNT